MQAEPWAAGHSSSWAQSLPELFVKCSAGPHGDFGGVSWMIDPTLEASYKFLDQFITEFGSRFPDRVLHFGGDQPVASDWAIDLCSVYRR